MHVKNLYLEKSANKRWKESGTTLTFKDWIDRDNKKKESQEGNFLPFDSVKPSDVVKDTLDKAKLNLYSNSGYKPQETKGKILGLDNGVIIFSSLLIIGSIGFYFYKKLKDKK